MSTESMDLAAERAQCAHRGPCSENGDGCTCSDSVLADRASGAVPLFGEGDIVETMKGAKFWGEIIALDNDKASPGCTVRAIDPDFLGTKHVYPIAQLRLRRAALRQPDTSTPGILRRDRHAMMVAANMPSTCAAAPQPAVKSSGGTPEDADAKNEALRRFPCVDEPMLDASVRTTQRLAFVEGAEWQRAIATPVTSSEAAIIERCAKVAESHVLENVQVSFEAGYSKAAQRIVEEIRALAALPAASREDEGVAVKVKALKWRRDEKGEWSVVLPWYAIWTIKPHKSGGGYLELSAPQHLTATSPSLENLLKTAEKTFQSVVRSALVQSTSPEAAGMVVSAAKPDWKDMAGVESRRRAALQVRIVELAKLSRALLGTLPDHWHDDNVTDLDDMVKEIERGELLPGAALSASEPHADERGKL